MRALLVHGFNVRDGGHKTTDRLRTPLEEKGYEVSELDYGWFGLLRVRRRNKTVAKILASLWWDYDLIIGHSNGCAIIHLAGNLLKRTQDHTQAPQVVFLNPALNAKAEIPASVVEKVYVYFSQNDKSTWMSKWLPWHVWGEMGKIGFLGNRLDYWNFDLESIFHEKIRHSDVFKGRKPRSIVDHMLGDIMR